MTLVSKVKNLSSGLTVHQGEIMLGHVRNNIDTSNAQFSKATEEALRDPFQHYDSEHKSYLISAVSGNPAEGNYQIKETEREISVSHQDLSGAASCFHNRAFREISLTDDTAGADQKLAYKLVMTNSRFDPRKVANSVKGLIKEDPRQFAELIGHMELKHAADVMNRIVSDCHGTVDQDLNNALDNLIARQPNLLAQMLMNGASARSGKPSFTECVIQRMADIYNPAELACKMNLILDCAKPAGKALLLKQLCHFCLNQDKSGYARGIMIDVLSAQLGSMTSADRSKTLLTLKLIKPDLFRQLSAIGALRQFNWDHVTPEAGDSDQIKAELAQYDFSLSPLRDEPARAPVRDLKDLENLTELTLGFGKNRSALILSSVNSALSEHITDKQEIAVLSRKILNTMREVGTELCFDTCVARVLAGKAGFEADSDCFAQIADKINRAILTRQVVKLSRSEAEQVVTGPVSLTYSLPEAVTSASDTADKDVRTIPGNGRVMPDGFVFHKVAGNGACLYRAAMAIKTRDQLWCQGYSNRSLLEDTTARRTLHGYVREGINRGINLCGEIHPETAGHLQKLANHLNVDISQLGDTIFSKCYAQGRFTLSSTQAMLSQLFPSGLNDDPQMQETLDHLVYTFGDILALGLNIPIIFPTSAQKDITKSLKRHDAVLLWRGNHYDIITREDYFTK